MPIGSAAAAPAQAIRMRVLVTGCGRSGTKYTAFALKRLGLDVPHERLGRDGIASWTMAVEAEARPYGPPSSQVSFEHVFHQVRHPLSTISSVLSFRSESWDFICRNVQVPRIGSPLLQAASYWLLWNEEAERIATWRYRVEDLRDNLLKEFCYRLGAKYRPRMVSAIPTNFNTRSAGRLLHLSEEMFRRLGMNVPRRLEWLLSTPRQHPPVLWDMLEREDSTLCERVLAKAAQYGYAPCD